MNFALTDDQRQLRDTVDRLLADHYGFEARRAIAASEAGYSTAMWQQFASLGLTALPIAETHGGLGGSAVDALSVMEAFGRSLVLEPYVASVVLGATALRLSGDQAQAGSLLPKAADGSLQLAFAHDEARSRHLPLWVETMARQQGGQWVLDGVKTLVLHGASAQRIVVTARVRGEPASADGVALFLLDPAAPGVQVRGFRLIDDTPAAELTLQGAAAIPLGSADGTQGAVAAIEGTVNAGIAALCGQALGAMQGAYDMTLAYLNTRQQFGRVIGSNQALRHRAAEMLVGLETARSAAMIAAVALDAAPSAQSSTDLMRAKLLVGRHGRALCQNAVQLHGGIGMTEEYAVGHYLRKLVVIDQLFGDEHAQCARLAHALAA